MQEKHKKFIATWGSIILTVAVFIFICVVGLYWVQHPKMSQMQVFMEFWKEWAILVVACLSFGFWIKHQ